jgi:Cdc6-like AAA superfamily ATPase
VNIIYDIPAVPNPYTYFQTKERENPTVCWIFGRTGTGKTKWVNENFRDLYWKDKTKWWDGYDK